MTRAALAALSRKLTVAFVCCLPFLVPFSDAARNTDMQGMVLLLSGLFGWTTVLLKKNFKVSLRPDAGVLLLVFSVCCLVSLAINPHIGYDWWGSPYIRLGTGGFLACIGCGLALRDITASQLFTGLYMIILALAVTALPYSWWHVHSLTRVGGLFSQADIFGVFLGCGLLIGLQVSLYYKKLRPYLLVSQALLAGLLVLSGTRLVLATMFVLLPVCWQHIRKPWRLGQWSAYVTAVIILFIIGGALLPTRVTNASYAGKSIQYRFDLQTAAVRASLHKPVAGYGPGNLANALACPNLSAPVLRDTCRKHYFFNSSHDIFLDRALGVGWIGGLAFFGLVVMAIYRAFRMRREYTIIGYVLVLISCYYLTNVTSVTLELLFWILLLRCLSAPSVIASKS
jgi:O-antigen ligase